MPCAPTECNPLRFLPELTSRPNPSLSTLYDGSIRTHCIHRWITHHVTRGDASNRFLHSRCVPVSLVYLCAFASFGEYRTTEQRVDYRSSPALPCWGCGVS